MVTLLLSGVLVLTLGGYLWWVRTQNLLVVESQAWNTALALAEAGVEEGLAQVNLDFGTNYTAWDAPVTRTLAGGTYSAVILPGNPGPTIIATGFASAPVISRTIKRTVQVTTVPAYAFGMGIAALQNVTMNGNNIMVDSYDSTDPAHSTTNGAYNPATRKAGGDVASTGGVLNVGNANVYGQAYTAPWGDATTLKNGLVGDLSWAGPGIEPGWYHNDYNANFKDVAPPYATGTPVAQNKKKSNPGYSTNSYTLGTGTYFVSGDFSIANNETLFVAGDATLYVIGNFTMQGQNSSHITIALGHTLKLYLGTTNGSAPVSASFDTVNMSPGANATNFQFYGLPSTTNLSWSGNSSYKGTVYAPEANFSLGGGGNSSTNDFQGSCVVQSVSMNGHFNVHYDENLKRSGPASGFKVASWKELP